MWISEIKFIFFKGLNLWLAFVIADSTEYCDREDFEAKCNKNQMVWIETATYGRMRTGKCISGAGYTGCSRDVTDYLHKKCSGKRNCLVSVNSIGDEVQPCKKDYVNYLDAHFKCIDVAVGDPVQCNNQQYTELAASHGILSSLSYDNNYGVTSCPWLIRAEQGQQIQLNITVFENAKGSIGGCPYSVRIEDQSNIISKSICGYGRNINQLYTSKSNVISVYNSFEMVSTAEGNTPPTFVVNYQMIGCADISAPHFSSVIRTGNDLTVRCDQTKETWFLTCKNNKWMGEIGNCTLDAEKVTTTGRKSSDSHIPFPQGLIAAVILGLILGIIIGFTSLGCYIIHKRRKQDAITNTMIDGHSLDYSRKDNYHDIMYQQQRDSVGTMQSSYYTGNVTPIHGPQQYNTRAEIIDTQLPKSLVYESPHIADALLETGSAGVHRSLTGSGNNVINNTSRNATNNLPHLHQHHHQRQNYELPSLPKQQQRKDLL